MKSLFRTIERQDAVATVILEEEGLRGGVNGILDALNLEAGGRRFRRGTYTKWDNDLRGPEPTFWKGFATVPEARTRTDEATRDG